MSKKLEWVQQELNSLREGGLYNNIRTLSSPQGARLTVDGKEVLNFCSNNYLGLANHPSLVAAARETLLKYGIGPGAVRTIAGTMDLHLELERRFAKFKGVEAAITFQSGFAPIWPPFPPWLERKMPSFLMNSTMPALSMAAGFQAPKTTASLTQIQPTWKGSSRKMQVPTGAG